MTINRRSSNPRTVKPRKPTTNANRHIYAIVDESSSDENGVILSTDELITRLRHTPPCIVVTATESAHFLNRVTARYGDSPAYNFRLAPVEREIFTGKQTGRRMVLKLMSVAYFGWQGEKCGRNNTVRNRYHLLIDPFTFSGKWLEKRTLSAYMEWAMDIRAFCMEQGWNIRPTQGSVARQALQDARFYPDARRKVPRSTNDRVRKHLPGNHYQLGDAVEIMDREYEADYLDQSRCHHYHAINTKLPDANSLYGYGYFRNPECGKVYKGDPKRISAFLDGFAGLICGYIYWPISRRKETQFLPRCLAEYGTENHPVNKPIYFYSEDLPLFHSLGIRCTGIVAAWGSKKKDTGLAKYAKFALDELGTNAPRWKKSLLLSPYGALATTPQKHTVAFHRSRGGKRGVIRSRTGIEINANVHRASKETEPGTNNVLHRALIESANRTETLLYARFLEELGYKVLCIYVDAVIVDSDGLPPAPVGRPWRLDSHLTRLKFLSESQFTSKEVSKLPGISGQLAREAISRGGFKDATYLGTKWDMRLRTHEAWLSGRLQKLA